MPSRTWSREISLASTTMSSPMRSRSPERRVTESFQQAPASQEIHHATFANKCREIVVDHVGYYLPGDTAPAASVTELIIWQENTSLSFK